LRPDADGSSEARKAYAKQAKQAKLDKPDYYEPKLKMPNE
jgi:hypothetical protein